MPLQALKIIKNWFTNTTTRESNWDNIANEITSFSTRTNNNLKQVGLDINGSTYDFNNVGVKTQTASIVSRLDILEGSTAPGALNLGLDTSTTSVVKIVSANGTALSTTNPGYVVFPQSDGSLTRRTITADIEVTLTGAHWGYGGGGDLTDQPLWVLLIEQGSSVVVGVGARLDRNSVTTADDETVATSVTTEDKVLVDTSLTGERTCLSFARILANFDDTGNGGGEDFWTIQTGIGDMEIGFHAPTTSSTVYF